MRGLAGTLVIFTVYDNPDDYPGEYVVRRSFVGPSMAVQDVEPLLVSDDLAEVRAAIPAGCIRLERDPFDPPAIMEVWL